MLQDHLRCSTRKHCSWPSTMTNTFRSVSADVLIGFQRAGLWPQSQHQGSHNGRYRELFEIPAQRLCRLSHYFGYQLVLIEQGNDAHSVGRRTSARGLIELEMSEILLFPTNGRDMLVLPEHPTSSSQEDRAVVHLISELPLFLAVSAKTPDI